MKICAKEILESTLNDYHLNLKLSKHEKSIIMIAMRRYAQKHNKSEVNGAETSQDKALHKHIVSFSFLCDGWRNKLDMKKEVNIIFSESWLRMDIGSINELLTETINEFVEETDRIINIEKHTDDSGSSRFWIYVESAVVNES